MRHDPTSTSFSGKILNMNTLSRLDKREIIKEESPGTCLLPSSGCCLCCCRCFHFVQFLKYTEMQVRPTLSAAVSCRILQQQRLNLAVRDPKHLSYCTGSHITNLHSYHRVSTDVETIKCSTTFYGLTKCYILLK
jgi:hypothetical protein